MRDFEKAIKLFHDCEVTQLEVNLFGLSTRKVLCMAPPPHCLETPQFKDIVRDHEKSGGWFVVLR